MNNGMGMKWVHKHKYINRIRIYANKHRNENNKPNSTVSSMMKA